MLAAVIVSFVYVAGQMAGVGLVFTRFLNVDTTVAVLIGMGIVFFYAVLGGMKGITWTQVAQYSVLIIAYLIPVVAISVTLTGMPVPQIVLITFLPCPAYRFLIFTITLLWNTPSTGMSMSRMSGATI